MKLLPPLLLSLLSLLHASAFLAPPSPTSRISSLHANKSGQGFAKQSPKSSSAVTTNKQDDDDATSEPSPSDISPLQSINTNTKESSSSSMADPKSILRNKYGLTSYEEQRALEGDERALIQSQKKSIQREKLRNIEKLWPEDKDLFEVLPPELLRGIDSVLKIGLGVCTFLFLISGVFITVEAGSKATGNALPEGLDGWIVSVVEPNFTPLLGVLLGFSVLLGLFSAGQLGSKGSVYREDP